MEGAEVHRLVTEVIGVDDDCRDREVLVAAVAKVARLQAWLDGRNVRLAAGLAEVAARPSRLVAEAARTSARDADRVLDRARTVDAIPALGEALDNGTVSGGHVDAVGRVLRQLEPRHHEALTSSAGWVVKLARQSTPAELHKALTVEMDQLRADDGVSRLERQRRATRLDTWIDDEGMWCLRGRFDPETGLTLHRPPGQHRRRPVRRQDPRRLPLPPPRTPSLPAGPRPGRPHRGTRHSQRQSPRSSPSSTSPTPNPTGPRPSTGGSPSSCPPRCCAACSTPPTSTRSSCAAASCSTPPAASTWAAPPGWPTGPNAAPCAPSTAPAPSPAATPATTSASSTTSSGGNTAARTDLANLLPLCVRHHHAVHDHGWHLVLGRRPDLDHHLPRRHRRDHTGHRHDDATTVHPGRRSARPRKTLSQHVVPLQT